MKGGRFIKQVWTIPELQANLADCVEPIQSYVLAGLSGTGARAGEFLELKPESFKRLDNLVRISIPTYKNKTVHQRTMILKAPEESWLIDPIMKYVESSVPDRPVLDYGKRWLEKKTKLWFGKHPHFFRHFRATYNLNYWGAQGKVNQMLMGWSDSQMESRYTHLTDADLINFIQKKMH